MADPFTAEIRMFTYQFAPRYWAYCDGQLLPIAQNTALFSLIGTIYGGDGITTFKLPDLKDRAPMHPGRGPGLTTRRQGELLGTPSVSLNETQMPSHNHMLTVVTDTPTQSTPNNHYPAKHRDENRGNLYKDNPSLDATFAPQAIGSSGNSQAHENQQPFQAVAFCICLYGIFPSRG